MTRQQIQAVIGHTDKRRVSAWLKDLREKHYLEWIYNGSDFMAKSKPASYYLGLNGIRFLRTLDQYPPTALRIRYKDSERTPSFITTCLLLVDCCINLEARSQSVDSIQYSYALQADYTDPASDAHWLQDLRPDLYFVKQETTKTGTSTKNYLLEIFGTTIPRYMLKKRLKDYLEYLDENQTVILLAFETTKELVYAKRRTKKLLEDDREDKTTLIRFATIEQVRVHGVTGIIWEEI